MKPPPRDPVQEKYSSVQMDVQEHLAQQHKGLSILKPPNALTSCTNNFHVFMLLIKI